MKKLLAVSLLAVTPYISDAASYQTVMVDSNRSIVYPRSAFSNISATIFTLNGQPLTSWTNCTVTNLLVSSNWAAWVATTNVDMNSYYMTNASTVYSTNIVADTIYVNDLIATNIPTNVTITAISSASISSTTNVFPYATIATGTITYLQAPGGVLKVKD